jgi:hypothetical protein
MSDPITLVTGTLSALKVAFDVVKNLKDADKAYVEANYKLQLSEVTVTLADARTGIAELKMALLERDQEIRDLKEKQRIKGTIVWDDPYFWIQEKIGGAREGPYCQVCYERDEKLTHLHFRQGDASYWCAVCRVPFFQPGHSG